MSDFPLLKKLAFSEELNCSELEPSQNLAESMDVDTATDQPAVVSTVDESSGLC